VLFGIVRVGYSGGRGICGGDKSGTSDDTGVCGGLEPAGRRPNAKPGQELDSLPGHSVVQGISSLWPTRATIHYAEDSSECPGAPMIPKEQPAALRKSPFGEYGVPTAVH
jgi:hypothetical protein